MCSTLSLAFLLCLIYSVTAVAQGPTAEEVLDEVRKAWQATSFHSLIVVETKEDEQTTSWRLGVWSRGRIAP